MSQGISQIVAAVVLSEGCVLITRRPKHRHLGGMWEFPGGKVEAGESDASALKRELREEVGLSVCVAELIDEVQHAYPDRTVVIRFYRCYCGSDPQLVLNGVSEARWVDPIDLQRYRFPPANERVVRKVQGHGSEGEADQVE